MIDDLVLLSTSAAILMIVFRAMTLDRLLPWFKPIPSEDGPAETGPSVRGTRNERQTGRLGRGPISRWGRSSPVSGGRPRR